MLCCSLCSCLHPLIHGSGFDYASSCTGELAKAALEHDLNGDSVLALRMLWASVRASGRWENYSRFLEAVPLQLRRSISSVVVLRFWGAAAAFKPGVRWLAVFEVDEVRQRQLRAEPLLAVKGCAAGSRVCGFCR